LDASKFCHTVFIKQALMTGRPRKTGKNDERLWLEKG